MNWGFNIDCITCPGIPKQRSAKSLPLKGYILADNCVHLGFYGEKLLLD